MRGEDAPRTPWRRRIMLAASAAVVIGGVGAALGPAAPWIVDTFADDRRIWRLGTLRVEGVRGGWIGDLRAARITLSDQDGVWLDARDVALDWRPQDLAFGRVRLNRGSIAELNITRQPLLTPSRESGGGSIDVRLDAIELGAIHLAEPVFGEAADFTGAFAFELRRREIQLIDLELRRADSDADRAIVLYRPDGEYALSADIESAPGGIFARALDVESLRVTAEGEGSPQTGAARYAGAIGGQDWFSGAARWTPTNWNAEAGARLDLLPLTAGLVERFGDTLSANASGERIGAFTLHAETPHLAADITGALDEDRALDGSARFVATTNQLSAIAPESPFTLGPARLEGELRRARGTTAIRADLDAQQIEALGQSVRFSGPVEAALTERRFSLNADLHAQDRPPALFAAGRLQTELNYNRARGRFTLASAALTGDALDLNAQGWANRGDGEFSGEWRVRRLDALSPDLAGAASGRWRAFSERDGDAHVWIAAIDGQGAQIGGASALVPQLLGAAPRLDARLRAEEGGLTLEHARINGENLRAGATGRIVQGEANINLEASARGPLDVGGAQLAGAIDATGRISGPIARPTVRAQAQLSSFAAGGIAIANPRLDFSLAPNGRGYAGRAAIDGQALGHPLQATSNLAIADGAFILTGLQAQLAGLNAEGNARFNADGAHADLALTGALDNLARGLSGQIQGELALMPDALTLNAQLADARAGELRVRAASLRAAGPFDAIDVTFNLRGRLRRAPLTFTGTGALTTDADTNLRVEGRGMLADADIFTRAPITLRWSDGGLDAGFNLALENGVVRGQWRERGRALSGSAHIEDAPLGPLAAIWGERATGRIAGDFSIANAGAGLSGDADLNLSGARFAGRQRGTLDMQVTAALTPNQLTADIDARSSDGLVARFQADAPVATSAAPLRIALMPERRGRATWSVSGPAETLWAAARLQDQSLQGQLNGEGELSFGAGYLSGDGDIEIAGGRFEDKLTGVTLVDLNAQISIGDNGVAIERFEAAGARGGRVTASGGSANARQGAIEVTLANLRVADRPDANAIASGDLRLEWEGLDSAFTGTINIEEANLDIGANPEAGIPSLDVIEINRPGYDDEDDETGDVIVRNNPTRLDVSVRAPGRVFTRGRGLDVEWALDLNLRGGLDNPRVFGTATSVRGDLTLSGQPFSIENARIMFDGDPLDAQINLTAERATADLTARINLSGTASNPSITLSSDPSLPEDEILPQVLFGRAVEDLSALEAAQLASSLAALSGRATFNVVDAARAAAGLDRFAVRQDEDGGFLVAGGVYLTRDVYVELARTGLGEAATRVEWTVRPRLVLITSFLGNGDQRVSVRWRRETD